MVAFACGTVCTNHFFGVATLILSSMRMFSRTPQMGCTTVFVCPSCSQYILRLVRFLNSGDIRREDDEPLFDVHQRKSITVLCFDPHTQSMLLYMSVCKFFFLFHVKLYTYYIRAACGSFRGCVTLCLAVYVYVRLR